MASVTPLSQFWNSIRTKPWYVAMEGAAFGAAINFAQQELTKGSLDFSKIGWEKFGSYVATAVGTALVNLYRPKPGTNPNA